MSTSCRDISAAARATRDRLQSFLALRLSSDTDAALVVAHLASALRWADSLPAATSFVARWQQVLRHAIVEHVRSGVPAQTRDRAWQAILAISHAQYHSVLAGCFAPLIAELPVDEALLLHHVEILGYPPETAARELGHSTATATALLARAEARLHAQLVQALPALSAERSRPAPKEIPRHTVAQLRAARRSARPLPFPLTSSA